RDRRWDDPAVWPWRRRPVRRPHGTRAHQPERRWGPPDRYRALSGLAVGCVWRRKAVSLLALRWFHRAGCFEAIEREKCVTHGEGRKVRRAKGRLRGKQPSRKLDEEKSG